MTKYYVDMRCEFCDTPDYVFQMHPDAAKDNAPHLVCDDCAPKILKKEYVAGP